MQITKSTVLKEVQAGGDIKDIAKRLGIPVVKLREAAKAFNINLRNKPRKEYSFVDDTNTLEIIDDTNTQESTNQLNQNEDNDLISTSTVLFPEITVTEDTEL